MPLIFHRDLRTHAMSTDSSQVDVALFPSYLHRLYIHLKKKIVHDHIWYMVVKPGELNYQMNNGSTLAEMEYRIKIAEYSLLDQKQNLDILKKLD